MAQKKINPTAYRLGIKQTWWTISHTSKNGPIGSIIFQDYFIRSLIKGILSSFNIFTSQIGIKRKGKNIFIDLLVFPSSYQYNQKEKFITSMNSPHVKLSDINSPLSQNISKIGIWSFIKSSKITSKSLVNKFYLEGGKSPFRLEYVRSLIQLILNKKFEGSNVVSISITQPSSLGSNAQILSQWIDSEIRKNPLKHKQVLNRAKDLYIQYQDQNSKSSNLTYIDRFKEKLSEL